MAYNLLKGKRGIITGALDENSIAWKVAQKVHQQGGTFVLSNAPVALRLGAINKLAEELKETMAMCGAFSLHSLSAFGLPTCFFNTGDLSFVCQFTEADTADSIFSQIRMRTSADSAAAIFSCGEFRLALLFDFHRCLCHDFPPLFCKRHIELFQ